MDAENEDEQIQKQCVQLFSSTDFIMESKVFDTIKDYFRHGGAPDQVIELLSENYMAIAQTATLMADWLILTGVEPADVVNMIVQHLQTLIEKHFEPKKADSIFEAGGVPSWLTDMTEHMNWRSMIYKLAEEYPNCLMLNFTIKLLVDSGHEDEITSVPVAAQQVEVFTKVLMTTIQRTIDSEPDDWQRNIQELVQLACHSEHTYLYAQSVLASLANDAKSMIVRRISEEIELHAKAKGHNVTDITLTFDGTTAYPKAYQPLCTMLSKKVLNPADITTLYKIYQSNDAPPVDLIRKPAFIELLITQLFDPDSTLNPEHRPKYIALLAYACSVAETNKKSSRKSTINSKEELSQTTIALEKAHEICISSKSTVDLISDLNELYKCLRFPIVAACVLRWIEFRIFDQSYFKLDQGTTPVHLIIIDEIVSLHFLLHQKAFELLVRVFEATFAELDILIHLEFKKTILDRMVHMLSCSFVHPILEYIKKRWEQQDTDVSLIRHFVFEVLEMIGPPYEPSFVQLFLPLLQNEAIGGTISLRTEEERKCVKEFIDHASTIVSSNTNSMRFCANLSTLFNDIPKLTERYIHVGQRKDYRFDAIECQNPYEVSTDTWKEAMAKDRSLKWILINSLPLYDQTNKIPSFNEYKKIVLDRTLDYAKMFNVSKVHLVMTEAKDDSDRSKIIDLVHQAAQFFQPHCILCLIEPLSTRSNYYLQSYSTAMSIVQSSNSNNLKIMLDSFHLQRLHGNLTERVKELAPFVGHVQISQTPNRDCPMNENGEVNHRYFLSSLIAPFYQDYIGLEYNDSSNASLKWLDEFTSTN